MTSAQEARLVDPSRLWPLIVERYERALATGAMHPLTTEVQLLEASGVDFVVRRLRNEDAETVRAVRGEASNGTGIPFSPPYDPDLVVGGLSATHVCLLNKYPVVPHHVLLVSRRFEEQEGRLASEDFVAACLALAGVDGLVFYNSGPGAGASQSHRHLQLVPLPLGPGRSRVPIEPMLEPSSPLPFLHSVKPLALDSEASVEQAAETVQTAYDRGLESLGLLAAPEDAFPAPYNLLMTRRWLYLVPRSRHAFRSIEVNALGFAGAFLVGDSDELETLAETGPLEVLAQVGVKRPRSP